jgi:cyclase
MKNVRVIARLDVKDPNVIKAVHLECLRIMGKPMELIRKYLEDYVGKLLYMDIVASLYQRNNLLDIVEEAAKRIFIPMTVGGGIRSLQDMENLLRVGADKLAINTAAIKNPNLITEGAIKYELNSVMCLNPGQTKENLMAVIVGISESVRL